MRTVNRLSRALVAVQREYYQLARANAAPVTAGEDLGRWSGHESPLPTGSALVQFQPILSPATTPTLPMRWWAQEVNFGDLLSPWLMARITHRDVALATDGTPALVAIGSIASRARRRDLVWGSGLFGREIPWVLEPRARYAAVRGPLTRSMLLNVGASCPANYGDPALLAPHVFQPEVQKTHKVGLVVRWSESRWRSIGAGRDVRIIDLRSSDVEGTLKSILQCEVIASSSLHGLVIADSYGIPNAWVESDSGRGGSRPAGGEFKFFDYFLGVGKVRHAQALESPTGRLEASRMLSRLHFDDRPITFDPHQMLDSLPLLRRVKGP